MDPAEVLLLVLAGVGAGLAGAIAGIASFVSYPALLAAGLPPLAANLTNTVAMTFQSIGQLHGSRPELTGQGPLLRRIAPLALAGGATGGLLLLLTPGDVFARVVPVLIAGAALAVLAPPRPHVVERAADGRSLPLEVGVYLVGIYGGYFGAAAGVLMVALLLAFTGQSLAHCTALRTVLLFGANGIAAIGFVAFGPVDWAHVAPLGLGLLVGGRIGPVVVRHSPARVLRPVIALAGLAMAAHLALDAW